MNARAEITDFWAMVFNPSSMDRLIHVWNGAILAGAIDVQGPLELAADRIEIQFARVNVIPCEVRLELRYQIARRTREREAGQEYSEHDAESVSHAGTMTH